MGFSKGITGEKCLFPGTYNPEHRHDNTVNLFIVKGDVFPLYDGYATVWKQTGCLCVLREYVRRFIGVKSN